MRGTITDRIQTGKENSKFVKRLCIVLAIVLLTVLCGCNENSKASVDDLPPSPANPMESLSPAPSVTPEDQNSPALTSPSPSHSEAYYHMLTSFTFWQDFEPDDFLGTWEIVGIAARALICGMDDETAEELIGVRITYAEDSAVIWDVSEGKSIQYENPKYEYKNFTKFDYYQYYGKIWLEQYGIEAETVMLVSLYSENPDVDDIGLGNGFLIKDTETIFTDWAGVDFEMRRVVEPPDDAEIYTGEYFERVK